MDSITAEELLIPLEEYATVGKDATLYDAIMALEKAQDKFDNNRYLHRAVLVLDEDGTVLGKVSQSDALRALEPKYFDMGDMRHLSRTGLSANFIKSLLDKYALCEISFAEKCLRAVNLKVTEFMYSPTEGEYIEADAPLCEAIHMLVMGSHHSLLVTRDGKVLGILRLADVFHKVFQTMKACAVE